MLLHLYPVLNMWTGFQLHVTMLRYYISLWWRPWRSKCLTAVYLLATIAQQHPRSVLVDAVLLHWYPVHENCISTAWHHAKSILYTTLTPPDIYTTFGLLWYLPLSFSPSVFNLSWMQPTSAPTVQATGTAIARLSCHTTVVQRKCLSWGLQFLGALQESHLRCALWQAVQLCPRE